MSGTCTGSANLRRGEMMCKTERFGMILTPDEKRTLEALAEDAGGLSLSATVRRLIRKEGQRLGLWPSMTDDVKRNW